MKKVELESLVKSFILFFTSQLLLIGALFFVDYKKEIQTLDESIFSKMRICSFDLVCKEFQLDFASLGEYELYRLYKDDKALSAYFSIPNSTKNALKIYLPKKAYNAEIKKLQSSYFLKFIVVLLVVALLSLLFAIYTISPLKNALLLTEEFIKDILHDFNTPLSTLRLNTSLLKEKMGENSKIKRIENSVQTILSLQSNLRAYLNNHVAQKEHFSLQELLEQRIALIDRNYRDIEFAITPSPLQLHTNKEAFSRIVDNLLSNAAKYNKRNGRVSLKVEGTLLEIEDSGRGIQNPKKVFDRFYKEQDRGIGIGLHIVKKLCEELGIGISLESKLGEGTTFYLQLASLT